MKKTSVVTVIVLAAVAGSGSMAYAAEPVELSTDEVRATLIGNTIDTDNAQLYFAPDGVIRGRSKRDGSTDKGSYWFTDDGIWCRKWQKWRGGSEECQRVKRLGEQYASVRPNGTVKVMFTVRTGNTEGL